MFNFNNCGRNNFDNKNWGGYDNFGYEKDFGFANRGGFDRHDCKDHGRNDWDKGRDHCKDHGRDNCRNRCRKINCFKVERPICCKQFDGCNSYPEPHHDKCRDEIICCFD